MPALEETKACPFCGETILTVAKKCRHCRSYLDKELAAANSSVTAVDRMLMPVGRPTSSIASGYLGLLAFFPLVGLAFGLAAVACGVAALRRINSDPLLHGRGRAWFGIIAGGLMTLCWTVLVISLVVAQNT